MAEGAISREAQGERQEWMCRSKRIVRAFPAR